MAPAHAIQLSRLPHNEHHADLDDDDGIDTPDEESATLLGGRGNVKRDHSHDHGEDDDDVAALRRAQKAARIGVLRELAAYCLKRPHVVCGVFLAAFFLIPIGWGVLFSSTPHLLECNANTTLQSTPFTPTYGSQHIATLLRLPLILVLSLCSRLVCFTSSPLPSALQCL